MGAVSETVGDRQGGDALQAHWEAERGGGGWRAGLAGGEMGEDCLDELGRVDTRDDAQRAAAYGAVFDVDVEDTLEPLPRDNTRYHESV